MKSDSFLRWVESKSAPVRKASKKRKETGLSIKYLDKKTLKKREEKWCGHLTEHRQTYTNTWKLIQREIIKRDCGFQTCRVLVINHLTSKATQSSQCFNVLWKTWDSWKRQKSGEKCWKCCLQLSKGELQIYFLSGFICSLVPKIEDWEKYPVEEQEYMKMQDRSREQEVDRKTIKWDSEVGRSKLLDKQE